MKSSPRKRRSSLPPEIVESLDRLDGHMTTATMLVSLIISPKAPPGLPVALHLRQADENLTKAAQALMQLRATLEAMQQPELVDEGKE